MHAGSHTGSAGLRFAWRLRSLTLTWFLSFHPSLIIKLLSTSAICPCGNIINDSELYHRVWVGNALRAPELQCRRAPTSCCFPCPWSDAVRVMTPQNATLIDPINSNQGRGISLHSDHEKIHSTYFFLSLPDLPGPCRGGMHVPSLHQQQQNIRGLTVTDRA
jgi:hypothetical protein